MNSPKFTVDQLVKFNGDHDRMTGKVVSFTYDSVNDEYTYNISSRYYDVDTNSMGEGVKICKEAELTDMTGYTGPTDIPAPDNAVNLNDQATAPDNTTPTDPSPNDPNQT